MHRLNTMCKYIAKKKKKYIIYFLNLLFRFYYLINHKQRSSTYGEVVMLIQFPPLRIDTTQKEDDNRQ